MGTPVLLIQDNFNRANGALLGSTTSVGAKVWQANGATSTDLAILSNEIVINTGGAALFVPAVAYGTVSAEVRAVTNWPRLYVCGSTTNANSHYRIEWQSTNTLYLEKDGSTLVTYTFPVLPNVGDIMALKAEKTGANTVLTVYKNGVSILTYSDTSGTQLSGTLAGIGAASAGVKWDNFEFRSVAENPDSTIHLGANLVSKAYLGSTQVSRIYLGTTRVL